MLGSTLAKQSRPMWWKALLTPSSIQIISILYICFKTISLKSFQWLILMELYMEILVAILVELILIVGGQEILINFSIQLLLVSELCLVVWEVKNTKLITSLICTGTVGSWDPFFMLVRPMMKYKQEKWLWLWVNWIPNFLLMSVILGCPCTKGKLRGEWWVIQLSERNLWLYRPLFSATKIWTISISKWKTSII